MFDEGGYVAYIVRLEEDGGWREGLVNAISGWSCVEQTLARYFKSSPPTSNQFFQDNILNINTTATIKMEQIPVDIQHQWYIK